MSTAYLIIECDKDTNAIQCAHIWSSPEWEQSMCLANPTFVAYSVQGYSYAEAVKRLLEAISIPRCRYHWILKYLDSKYQDVLPITEVPPQ